MVYFYYKLSLPTSDGIPEVIEEEVQPLRNSYDISSADKSLKNSHQSNGIGSSFARFMENDQEVDP